jgi:GH25 family lysozyme M1 (1,4-beta-N-acetylmuramidase)
MANAQGRDYSAYQPPVDSEMLKGLSFAYTRVSNWDGTTMSTDPNFAHNWAEIKAARLHRGAYWYLMPDVDAVSQARYFVDAVKKARLDPGDMLVCDSETLTGNVDEVTHSFCRETASLAGPHCPVIVYSNENVGQHLTSCTYWPYWMAWISSTPPTPSETSPWKDWTFWQWGTVDDVDADYFHGTPEQLDTWIDGYLPKPAPPPEDEEMILVMPAREQVPAGTDWPGIFLLFCDGTLSHVLPSAGNPPVSNLAAYQSAGIKGPVTITWDEYQALLAINPS